MSGFRINLTGLHGIFGSIYLDSHEIHTENLRARESRTGDNSDGSGYDAPARVSRNAVRASDQCAWRAGPVDSRR